MAGHELEITWRGGCSAARPRPPAVGTAGSCRAFGAGLLLPRVGGPLAGGRDGRGPRPVLGAGLPALRAGPSVRGARVRAGSVGPGGGGPRLLGPVAQGA